MEIEVQVIEINRFDELNWVILEFKQHRIIAAMNSNLHFQLFQIFQKVVIEFDGVFTSLIHLYDSLHNLTSNI